MNKMNFLQCICVGTALLLSNLAHAQGVQPCNPQVDIGQGDAAVAASNPTTALAYYMRAQSCASTNRDVGAWITLAGKFLALGKVDYAVAALQEAHNDSLKWIGWEQADQSRVNCTYGRGGLAAVIAAAQGMLTLLPAASPARGSVDSVLRQANDNQDGLNRDFGPRGCPFVLSSGTYTVQVDNYGHRYASTWVLTVTDGQITGWSTWDCCPPGYRRDRLWGHVTRSGDPRLIGSSSGVVIERDCTGYGQPDPACHEVFTGKVERDHIRGTLSGTGAAPGNEWTLRAQ